MSSEYIIRPITSESEDDGPVDKETENDIQHGIWTKVGTEWRLFLCWTGV